MSKINHICEVLQLTFYRMMNHISQGVTEGICRTMEDLPKDTSDVEGFAQSLTKEWSNSLSAGVPRRLFDALYLSFSELNSKLASRVEINITPECHDSGHHFELKSTPQPSPPLSASSQSLGYHDYHKGPHDTLEPSEEQSEGTVDRCCMCLTPASEEELMTTPCCFREVGSICWQERMQETGECCLCQARQTRCSTASSDGAPDYKVHFTMETHQDGTDGTAEIEMNRADSFEPEQDFSTGSVTARDPPSPSDTSNTLIASVTAKKETEIIGQSILYADFEAMRTPDERHKSSKFEAVSLDDLKNFSRGFKLPTPVPEDIVPFLSPNTDKQQNRELVKDTQLKTFSLSALNTMKSQVSADSEEPNPQTEERDDHLDTKFLRLKLIDQDVICHIKDLDRDDLLDLVHSALKERERRTLCKNFLRQAKVLKNRNVVDISICLKCSQDSDLMITTKDWSRDFESFILTTQLRKYKVTGEHVHIGTKNILRGPEKLETIRTLVNDNKYLIKSLKSPADIQGICWNKDVNNLKPFDSTSVTITFATAQLANEAIEHGLVWNHERHRCRRQGAHAKIIQCGRCQAYGHIPRECSSAPRCKVCAGMHLSTACNYDSAANKACLKCALCGGAHEATSEVCKSREAERRRVKLANPFYPNGPERVEQNGTANAA